MTIVRLTLIHARFGLKIIVPPVYFLDQIGPCKTLFQMDFNTESDVVVYLIHRFITLFFSFVIFKTIEPLMGCQRESIGVILDVLIVSIGCFKFQGSFKCC